MLVLKLVLAIAFVLAGGVKIFKAKPMVDQFKEFGLPDFGVQLVGVLEVVCAIGLLIPPITIYAAILLIILMIGAVFNHVKTKHNIPTIAPAFVLGILSSVLVFLLMR